MCALSRLPTTKNRRSRCARQRPSREQVSMNVFALVSEGALGALSPLPSRRCLW